MRPWLVRTRVKILCTEPGMSSQNGWNESFHSRLTEELLSMEISCALDEAKALINWCRRHYYIVRPHRSLGNRLPGPKSNLPNVRGPTHVLGGLRSVLQLNFDLVSHMNSSTQPAMAKRRLPLCPLVERDSSQPDDRKLEELKMRSTDPISASTNKSNKKLSRAVSASRGRPCPSLCFLSWCPVSHAAGSHGAQCYRDRVGPRRSLRRGSDRHVRKARTRACGNRTVDSTAGVFCEVIATILGGRQGVYVPVDNDLK